MSDSNIGARKHRTIKDHLLIMHGTVHSIVAGKDESADIQVFDLEKAFDSLWMENCLSDIYDSLSMKNRNKKLALLYFMNKTNLLGVRMPFGMTERKSTPDIVQQGGIWGPTLCSNHTVGFGRKC